MTTIHRGCRVSHQIVLTGFLTGQEHPFSDALELEIPRLRSFNTDIVIQLFTCAWAP
jgi:hypothetical protein